MPTPSLTLFQSAVSYLVSRRKINADTDLYNVDKNDIVPRSSTLTGIGLRVHKAINTL